MAIKLEKIINIINKIVQLENTIELEITKEKDAKKRKTLRNAVKNRDSAALRKLWFK